MDNETKEFIREVFTLSLPVGFQQIINLTVNMIDNIMVGQMGELAITAVSISGTFTWLVMVFGTGLAHGANVVMAQDWGSGNVQRIKKLFSFVITMSFSAALIFFVLTSLFPERIIQIYSSMPQFVAPGVEYLSIMKYSFLLTSISQMTLLMLQSVRSVKIGLYNSILSCFTNIFLNWVLIFGHLGFPALGIRGAALATVIARSIELVITLTYLFRFEPNLQFRPKDFHPVLEKEFLLQYIHITLPLLIIDVFSNLVSSVQTMISGRISQYYISANSIVHMAWTIPNSFCVGVSASANIMVGNLIGSSRFDTAKSYAWKFVRTALLLGVIASGLVQVILPVLSNFYKITDETRILTRQMGYAASCTVLFLPLCFVVFNGILKAGGQTRKLMYVDMAANWLIAIPFGYIAAFVLHWHPAVLYAVLRSGNLFKAGWGLLQLKKGDWIHRIA
ncbi:MAG: MATE family efflux transporter [Erysipelotrichaceae bacterium]|nr:MATE family efflux transporter [Erysipelotrichaceae bacterium]